MTPVEALAIGLDLGTTRIKAARLSTDGRLHEMRSVHAPPLSGEGVIREGDAEAYFRTAHRVLEDVARGLPRGTPLGIASQRSTFALWDGESGRPVSPMISWQDRRAAEWCARHRSIERFVLQRTGLRLSGHYAGPKLAALKETDAALGDALASGACRFGTLDAYWLWHETAARVHETDLTMAARTLMVDLAEARYSPDLLQRFHVPIAALPSITTTAGRAVPLSMGPTVTATIADQAAGALAVFDGRRPGALVNLGTGAFVLRPGDPTARDARYLTGPILCARTFQRYAVEGPINGAGPALDRFHGEPVELPESDPHPDAFAIPDLAGLGAPHWRPDLGLTLSPAAERLAPPEQRRVVLEGLLFRIREVLWDLECGRPERVILAGGLARDPAVGTGLAAVLGRTIELLLEPEAVLLGAARLSAGLDPHANPRTSPVEPGSSGSYLPYKYTRWRAWLASLL